MATKLFESILSHFQGLTNTAPSSPRGYSLGDVILWSMPTIMHLGIYMCVVKVINYMYSDKKHACPIGMAIV